MTSLDRIVELLQNHGSKTKKLNSTQWQAQCPAHEDRTSSLSVGEGAEGKVLLTCHAGCTLNAITGALGITTAELFNSNGYKGSGDRIVNVYDYHDEDGNLIYQVVKKTGKQFVQRRPDGQGDWIWNLQGVDRVPYHLPDLTAGIAEGKTIFIVEGEKDADRVRTLGLVATTLPGGADKWRSEYRHWFEGADLVVILPDNDAPGKKHAATVTESLLPVVAKIKIVELPDLPDKGDVSDWMDAGGTIDDLRHLVKDTKPQTAGSGTIAELLEEQLDPIRWVVKGLIPEGLTFIAGKTKIGKTWFTYLLALAVCSGQDVLQLETQLGEVLTIALEDGKRRIQDRVQVLGANQIKEHLHRYHYRTEWPTFGRGALEQLEQWMVDHPQTRMIIIDTWGRIRGSLPGKDHYSEEYALLGSVQNFAIRHRIAVVLVHHLRKQGADDWLEQLSGSQAVTGAADTILGLYRDRGQMDAVLRTVSRDAQELELALRFENDSRWVYMGPAAEYRHSVERQAVLDALRDLGGQAQVKDIAEACEKTPVNTSKLLVKLEKEKVVVKIKHGVYALESAGGVVDMDISTPTKSTTPTTTTATVHGEGLDTDEIDFNDVDPY